MVDCLRWHLHQKPWVQRQHLNAVTLVDCSETDAVWGYLPPVLAKLLLPSSGDPRVL